MCKDCGCDSKESKKTDKESKVDKNRVAKDGDCAVVHYTGTLEDGTKFDSSEGREPLEFVLGSGMLIPGFNDAVVGLKPGDKKSIKLKPKDAYGEYDDKRTQEVPKDNLPKDQEPKAGMMLIMSAPNGAQIPAAIREVKDDVVVIDLNHPLAGKTLNFDIEVINVKDAPEKSCGDHHCGDHDCGCGC